MFTISAARERPGTASLNISRRQLSAPKAPPKLPSARGYVHDNVRDIMGYKGEAQISEISDAICSNVRRAAHTRDVRSVTS